MKFIQFVVIILVLQLAIEKKFKSRSRGKSRHKTQTLSLAKFQYQTGIKSKYRFTMETLAEHTRKFYKSITNLDTCTSAFIANDLPSASTWLGVGYSVIDGNPIISPASESLIDKGFKQDIFNITSSGSITSDGLYNIPIGYEISVINSCSASLTSTTMDSTSSVKSEAKYKLGLEGEVEVGPVTATLTGNVEYTTIKENIETQSSVYIEESATCNIYEAKVQLSSTPPLTTNFLKGIKSLDGKTFTSNANSYYNFYDQFGTHYLSEVQIGSKFVFISSISRSSYETLESSSIDVETTLESSVDIMIGDTGAKATSIDLTSLTGNANIASNNSTKSVVNSLSSVMVQSVGAPMPSDLTLSSWLKGTKNNPMATTYKVKPITDLLERESVKLFMQSYGVTNVDQIFSGLTSAYNSYCDYRSQSSSSIQCSSSIPVYNYEKYTEWKAENKWGDISALKEHLIDCGSGMAINFLKLQYSGESLRYKYKCTKSDQITSTCTTSSTKDASLDGDKFYPLTNFNLTCGTNYVMKSFYFGTLNNDENGLYTYTCCQAGVVGELMSNTSKWFTMSDNLENMEVISLQLSKSEYVIKEFAYESDGNNNMRYNFKYYELKTSDSQLSSDDLKTKSITFTRVTRTGKDVVYNATNANFKCNTDKVSELTDSSDTTGVCIDTSTSNAQILFELNYIWPITSFTIGGYKETGFDSANSINGAKVEFSQDNKTWETITTLSGLTDSTTKLFSLTKSYNVKYIKLSKSGTLGVGYLNVKK